MKKFFNIAFLLAVAVSVQAQKVTFYSPEFGEGVRLHLGLDENDDVQQTQMDTITCISLSGLGITDIRDAVYLPTVRVLDLSYNNIDDVSPLLPLDSLRRVDLSNNQLENINILALSNVDTMEVDVSNNYIGDFSYFYSPTHCEFTLLGMGLQQDKNAPYFDVYQLFVDINAEGRPEVYYRGYTNIDAPAHLVCGDAHTAATLDGDTRSAAVPGSPTSAMMVALTNGEHADTTWVVPPTEYEADGGTTVAIATGLPEDYTIASAYTKDGREATISGTTLSYQTAADYDCDTLYISYYEGSRLRGFSELYVVNPDAVSTLSGDVNNDRRLNIADVTALINHLSNRPATRFIERNADMNKDSKITSADIPFLVNKILGIKDN